MPIRCRRLLAAVTVWVLSTSYAWAQCALTGDPAAVATLEDRQILSGEDEVIVRLPTDGPGFTVGWAPKGSETSPTVPGGRRVIGGRDTIRYSNRSVPAQQEQELHIIGAGVLPARTVIGPARKPVVLVIISNDEMARWKLFVAPGTRVARVILQGMRAEVEGLPAGVGVERRQPCVMHTTGRGVRRDAPDIEYSPARIRRVLADIRAHTGLVETSFQHGFAPASLLASSMPQVALPTLDHMYVEQIARATDAKILDYMDAVRARLPEVVRPTVSLLSELVRKNRLPAATFTEHGDRLPLLWFPPDTAEIGSSLKCASNVLVGQGQSRSVRCPGDPRIYFMEGAGRSMIRESGGNSLFAPGRGSSFIQADTGRDVIVLERGWGLASISKTCGRATSRLRGRRPPLGMVHTGFIAFGAGVRPSDLAWLPLVRREYRVMDDSGKTLSIPQRMAELMRSPPRILVNRATRDILILKPPCFNFVFLEDGRLAPPSWPR